MRVVLPLTAEDFPPHIQDLRVGGDVAVRPPRGRPGRRADCHLAQPHAPPGRPSPPPGRPRPAGSSAPAGPPAPPWQVLLGREPTGTWELQLPDDELVRSWFRDELIEDLVLVLTLNGTTPAWP